MYHCKYMCITLVLWCTFTEKVDFAESERIVTFDSSHMVASDPECITVAILHDEILEDTETFLMEINKIDKSLKFRLEPYTVICEIVDSDSGSE